MNVKFITTLILIIPILGFSQINQSIDFISGIDYSYRHLTTSSEDEIIKIVLENREKSEIGKLNWRIGFNYNYKISNKIFLKAGLRLASIGYKTKKGEIRWGSQHDGMGGWTTPTNPNLPSEIQFISNHWFTEIPIAARFEINQRKISPFFELGISPSFYMTTREKTITDIETISEFQNSNANKFHIVGFISFGINYSINDKIQLFGQPAFRYYLTNLKDTPINQHLFNYGIEIGIRNKIK